MDLLGACTTAFFAVMFVGGTLNAVRLHRAGVPWVPHLMASAVLGGLALAHLHRVLGASP